jgi:predicted neuraminidase
MTDGKVMLPVYHEFFTKFAELLQLDASGKVVDKIRIPGSRTDLQPVIIASNLNDAQVYMRSGSAAAVMMSSTQDGGKTWSVSQPTTWPNPDSAVAGVAMGDATQWLALNPGRSNREQLALMQTRLGGSFEGQALWRVEASASPNARLSRPQYEHLLGRELALAGVEPAQLRAYVASAMRQLCHNQECAQEYSYPYLLKGRDGSLHLIYTWHRTRIKHVRLDPTQPLLAVAAKP